MEFLNNLGITQAEVTNYFLSITPNLIAAFVALIFFVIFYLVTARVLRSALGRTHVQASLQNIIVSTLYKNIIVVFAIIMILNQLGVDVTAAIAGVGVVGIAIGFAAKETLANALSGFSIFIDKLYQRGDWVEIAGQHGQVKNISLRTTKIRTLDNIFIIVPNSEVTQSPVINYSEEGMVRVKTEIGIAYNESVDQAREVLLKAIKTINGVLTEPEPQVVVTELADSSVNLSIRVWVDDAGTDPKFQFELNEISKKALDEAGIEIPFPQRVVHQGK